MYFRRRELISKSLERKSGDEGFGNSFSTSYPTSADADEILQSWLMEMAGCIIVEVGFLFDFWHSVPNKELQHQYLNHVKIAWKFSQKQRGPFNTFLKKSFFFETKGRMAPPKRMNFRKNSKRPLTPPHFWKIILRISRQNCDKSAYVPYGGTVIT